MSGSRVWHLHRLWHLWLQGLASSSSLASAAVVSGIFLVIGIGGCSPWLPIGCGSSILIVFGISGGCVWHLPRHWHQWLHFLASYWLRAWHPHCLWHQWQLCLAPSSSLASVVKVPGFLRDHARASWQLRRLHLQGVIISTRQVSSLA
jgi:hypothetical protein